jgi:hypothetical protein
MSPADVIADFVKFEIVSVEKAKFAPQDTPQTYPPLSVEFYLLGASIHGTRAF